MVESKQVIRLEDRSGEPVMAGGLRIIPQSQALTIRLPFGGLVYNRPTAVLIESGGSVVRVPIVDVTRVILLGLWAFSLFFALTFIGRIRR